MDILDELKTEFPDCWFKAGKEFDGSENRIVWSGEGSMIGNLPAFDPSAWEFDSLEYVYVMDVHKKLNDFVEVRGYYWESYDAGTFFLYKI